MRENVIVGARINNCLASQPAAQLIPYEQAFDVFSAHKTQGRDAA